MMHRRFQGNRCGDTEQSAISDAWQDRKEARFSSVEIDEMDVRKARCCTVRAIDNRPQEDLRAVVYLCVGVG